MRTITSPTRRPTPRRSAVAITLAATLVLAISAPALAGQPTITKVDFSQFEPFAEADWTAECGFPVDVTFKGHIVFREFSGSRLIAVDTWQTFQSYSANGKTFVAPSTNGPDMLWLAGDGTTYFAIAGRSPADGIIGRLVFEDGTHVLVDAHGREIDNPYDDVCAAIAP